MIQLQRPSLELFSQFQEFLLDMSAHGEKLWEPYTPAPKERAEDFIKRQLNRQDRPEPNLVPETVYWAIHDGHVVGRISLRHTLNENLKKVGGHIGYEVRPTFRKRGFATEMLRLLLLTPKAQEIGNLMLTCAPDNIASNKTILTNGGRLVQTVYVEMIGAERHHYWIDLKR